MPPQGSAASVLYAVSPIGLGHATRAAAIGLELLRMGVDVRYAAGGAAADALESYGFRVDRIVEGPNPIEVRGRVALPSLWYLRYWRSYNSNRKRMARLLEAERPDLVVGDEEFSSLSLALETGLKNAMVSDELQLGFARSPLSRAMEGRARRWYEDLQRRVSCILVPDFGEDRGNVRHVTPVVRRVARGREQLASEYGLPAGGSMVLFSMSGSGLGGRLARAAVGAFRGLGLRDAFMVVTGGRRASWEGVHHLGVVRDNHELVAAADLVITSAGKSTIDEAASYGTPIIAIPFKHHFEQERNAEAIGFRPEDIGRLDELIVQRLGRRTPPKDYQGAGRAAGMLAAMARA
ncbi:MAG: hypothetical protein JRN39_06120 [Nitrososphaerota archaeon]|nr:hypothetical protein [Nitrososphaerota archaeon]MDG6939958.1 hypothetical protein [Nitrososphaerota archaeon]